MRFAILGELWVELDGRTLAIPGRKPRTLLAALLTHANQFVSKDQLVDVLWGNNPPPGVVTTLRGYVLTLRRALDPTGHDPERLRTGSGGYLLHVADGELDRDVFTSLLDRARSLRAQRHDAAAVAMYRDALALWRGSPLCDIDSAGLEVAVAPRLESMRLAALSECMDASLRAGMHEQVVPELEELVRLHPLHEGFRAQLMLALYRSGRQSDALRAYQDARASLVEESGLEPGARLEGLHLSILRGEDVDDVDRFAGLQHTAGRATMVPSPCELPPALPDFVGRSDLLDAAEAYARESSDGQPHPRVVVIVGPPGVGTSSCGLELAHRLRDTAPDGQLHMGLRGTADPVRLREVLRGSLVSFGFAPADLPDAVEDLVRIYRRETAHRRLLVMLDDVSEEAVRDLLLPSVGGSLAIVTTSAPLWNRGGEHLVLLGPMTDDEALVLFGRILGDLDETELDAARVVARWCDHQPVALRAACGALRSRPPSVDRMAKLGARLSDDRRRLEELGRSGVDLHAVLRRRFAHCTALQRTLLVRLAGGRLRVTPSDVARMLRIGADEAEDAVHGPWRQGLLTMTDDGRYALACLARAYVVTQSQVDAERGRSIAS